MGQCNGSSFDIKTGAVIEGPRSQRYDRRGPARPIGSLVGGRHLVGATQPGTTCHHTTFSKGLPWTGCQRT